MCLEKHAFHGWTLKLNLAGLTFQDFHPFPIRPSVVANMVRCRLLCKVLIPTNNPKVGGQLRRNIDSTARVVAIFQR
jgi:hypothetical protein